MAKRSGKKKVVSREMFAKVAGTDAASQSLSSSFSRDWLWGSILVLGILVTYQPVWYAGFIWDDDAHVTPPGLRSWEGLGRIWFDLDATQQYYPLVHSFFWAEYSLWGDEPLGYHLVNVLLFVLSALLLLKILQQLKVPGAYLATGIFALHPVQVESVAWVSELKNMFSGVFYLGSVLVYLSFDRTRKRPAYVASLILFVLGLLSKSVIATLPAALLLILWWKRGKLSWKQDALPLVPFFIAGISSGLFTSWVEQHVIGAEGDDFNYTLIERTLIAGRDLWFYLGNLVWPTDLIFIYPRWQMRETIWWQYLFPLAALAVAVALGWLSRRWRGPLAGFLFFAVTLFPALGFFNVFPFRYSFVADHFQYLACLGIIVPCAAGMALLSDAVIPKRTWLQQSLCAGLWLILGILSWQRAWAFESEEALWRDTVVKNPNCWLAHDWLGWALYQEGRLAEAITQYQEALALKPNYLDAHINLGLALAQNEQLDEAIAQFRTALAIAPAFAVAHSDLATALAQKGQFAEAIAQYQEALRLNPDFSAAKNNLAVVRAMAQQKAPRK